MNLEELHHICIQTEVYSESLDFYVNLLGFEIIKENYDFHEREFNTWIKAANCRIELQTPKKGTNLNKWSSLNSGPVHLAFVVNDVVAAYTQINQFGYKNFKMKNGKELYSVNQNTTIFKIIAPEGTEIEIRENANLD
ncbi:MAG: VOC family protein [Bacteroidales bacterium]|nr:VOC family protein [Bacteroidales bacterium]